MQRLAVVIFNLGGPDGLPAVEPFLFNLFSDPAIISAPQPFRWLIAKLISKRRTPLAQEIYSHVGGKSPLLGLTNDQAQALQSQLQNTLVETEVKVFVCMRYWHPFSHEVAEQVKNFAPTDVTLLPLYPQYSTTTTESSFKDWDKITQALQLNIPTKRICCYPTEPGFINAQAQLLKAAIQKAKASSDDVRVLFSAHGLPTKIVQGKGDPYPDQVAKSAQGIVQALADQGINLTDWLVCYQSRVGPLEWIGPSTEEEIKRAGADDKALVVLPIAFVSEHSETLVELDIEYKELAQKHGVNVYIRVPAVGTHTDFIGGLNNLVIESMQNKLNLCAQGKAQRLCKQSSKACPMTENAR